MAVAALIFFIAILVGILFLGGLIWLLFRGSRRRNPGSRNFSGNPSNYGGVHQQSHQSITETDDDSAIYAGSALFADGATTENAPVTETAYDAPFQSGVEYAHENRGAESAPAEPSYTESSYSGSDSGSSYDSGSSSDYGSSSDSGSSSSDGGSSSSSSD